MFLYSRNLTERSMYSDVLPWDFKPTEVLTAQLRHDKDSRQEFYQTVTVRHHFYTGIEAANPNQRVSKDNPPVKISGIPGDFDLPIPRERVMEAIAAMKYKPSYIERSLGGNVRLVWTLPRSILVDSYEFCTYLLQQLIKFLSMDFLPGLDENAFTDPSRLLCNGCEWEATGHGPIPEADLQAFYVRCAKDYAFVGGDLAEVPLDVAEKELRVKYPNFSWPSDFSLGSQGPSFWIDGSTSAQSAIVKKDGMFTFSGHASKPFWSWGEILGKDFIEKFSTETIAKATTDIYWDSKRIWRKYGNNYQSCDKEEFRNYLLVQCRLSNKPDKSGISPIDAALNHVYNAGRIKGGAPFVFQRPGIVYFNGDRVLNIYDGEPILPSDESTVWGEDGKAPLLTRYLDYLLGDVQIPHWKAWMQRLYKSALDREPLQGQNIALMGPPSSGKTLLNRIIIGMAVGGFSDASEYLARGGGFNSQLLEKPIWSSDDDSHGDSTQCQNNFNSATKKAAANPQHMYSRKYEVPTMVRWSGRVVITLNEDYTSSRTLGALDNSSLDKICIFLCRGGFQFPEQAELQAAIKREMPYLLRLILDYKVPDYIERDARYGYKAYHNPKLLDQVHQGSKSAPFKEILVEALRAWFLDNPKADCWRGTLSQITRMVHSNPLNESVIRTLKLEQTNRYLEAIQREGLLQISVETGELKTRFWVIARFGDPAPVNPPTIPTDSKYESQPVLRETSEGTSNGKADGAAGTESN